jgi:cholesterol transport system auxiliary component
LNHLKLILIIGILCQLSACSPVRDEISGQYLLESFSSKRTGSTPVHVSLLISQPDAVAGYQTEQMIYTDKPYESSHFAHNVWVSSPANMIFPLMIQSLQNSHYFFAIASSPDSDKTDYRLDTQVIELQQNFLKKPSVLNLIAKVTLTHVPDNRVVASRLVGEHIPCPKDSPYGGVLAANQATYKFTAKVTHFVIGAVQRDQRQK